LVFGVLIDVPLLTVTFILLVVYRKNLARTITRARLPPLLLFLMAAVPLIIFEEQIDCMPSWCGRVIIPPTLYFIEVEMLVLGLLVVFLHARSAPKAALAFSVYGVFFEYALGGLRGLPPSLEAVFLVPYVGMGYAFVSLLPLEILLAKRAGVSVSTPASAAVQSAHLRELK
jgi:hypothetical protein